MTDRSTQGKTAKDAVEGLGRDPQHLLRERDRLRWQRRSAVVHRERAAPLLHELEEAGFSVELVSDLYTPQIDYSGAIPILIKWLPQIDDDGVRESIVRALSVKWARPHAAQALLRAFHEASVTAASLKWAIANALSIVSSPAYFDDIAQLIRDATHGTSRQMLAVALGRMKDPRAEPILLELLDDPDIHGHAIIGLRSIASPSSREHIAKFLEHDVAWIRNEAKRAVAKIDKKHPSFEQS